MNNKRPFWSIQTDYEKLANTIINNGGEVSEAQLNQLAINETERNVKSVAYYRIINNIESENMIIKKEIDRLNNRLKSNQKTIDRLEKCLIDAILLYGEYEHEMVKFKTRKSTAVEVNPVWPLDAKYTITKTTIIPDKTLIKNDLKNGVVIDGCHLVENHHLNIK